MQRQLSDYFRFLAILDTHINKNAAENGEKISNGTLTLRSIVIWTQDFIRKLRLMNVMIDCCTGEWIILYNIGVIIYYCFVMIDQKGGALVSQIHAYSNHGDPFIRQFVGETLEEVRYK
jgi:gamma-tubulin complex component 3